MPAIYSGTGLAAFRQWLGANCYAAKASIGGSFVSSDIADHYQTPWDLGYGAFAKFDHEFVGRAALERLAALPHRRKVTLALDSADVTRVMSSMFQRGERAKAMELPSYVYAMHPFDEVRAGGKCVGLSTWIGYSANEGRMLTLAMLDEAYAKPGTAVSLPWGEPNGGTKKLTVEPHVQTEIHATVAPVPYAEVARDSYAEGWRTRQVTA